MSGDTDRPELDRLERVLGHEFADRALLEKALVHASYGHEHEGVEDNERLEFLGDSVIGMVTADLLYRAHPDWPEGDLTRALHRLVDRRGLSALARKLELGDHLRLGRTELRSAGSEKETILADAMEAVIGALYLDGGVAPVERFARTFFADALEAQAPRVGLDPKTRFQEWTVAHFGVFPRYRTVGDNEVEGDDARFTVEVLVGGEPVGRATGRSKRQAERRAADAAYAARETLEPAGQGDA